MQQARRLAQGPAGIALVERVVETGAETRPSRFRWRFCQVHFDDTVHEDDQVGEAEGFRVVCDPKSFLYLNGTQLDFEESLMGRGFKFGNPNASKTCGCGESFTV